MKESPSNIKALLFRQKMQPAMSGFRYKLGIQDLFRGTLRCRLKSIS